MLATELDVDADGRCTGALARWQLPGPEKVARLHAWLDDRHGGRAAVELWAYGDSRRRPRAARRRRPRRVGPADADVVHLSRRREPGVGTRACSRTARPKQWLKNVLVFAAPGAAGVLDDWPQLGWTLLAFVAFCLAASGIYFWNDALDVEADRIHPTKRLRPIAAGIVPVAHGQGRRHAAARRRRSASPR